MRMSTGFLFKEFFTGLWISYTTKFVHAVPTRYNLTESRHQPNPWSAFCVCSDSARAVPKQTSRPGANPKVMQSRPRLTQDPESRQGVWYNLQTCQSEYCVDQPEHWLIKYLVDNVFV